MEIEAAASALPVAEARRLILERVRPLPPERVALAAAVGRVTALPIRARRDLPPWDNSAMDGYAVRAADVAPGVELPVALDVPAGASPDQALPPGAAARIMTGAPLPAGADAIVPVEATEPVGGEVPYAPRGGRVRIQSVVERGDHVRRRGEDVGRDEVAVAAGVVLRGPEIAMAAAVGHAMATVVRRPRVAIVPTGDELVDLGDPAPPDRIVNGNAYGLAAEVTATGGEPLVLPIAPDDERAVRRTLEDALSADATITIGGVSVGEHDHVRPALAAAGVEILFWRAALKPGGPTAFGTTPDGRPVFCLPGNPVSALVTFLLFARPGLLALQGAAAPVPATVRVRLGEPVATRPGREHWLRVRIRAGADGWVAEPSGPQGSAVLSTLVAADGLLRVPADRDGLPAGAEAEVLLLRNPGSEA